MRKTVFIILAMLAAVSCVEEFSPDLRKIDAYRVVVDAVLTTDTSAHCVRVSTSAPYGTASELIPVISGASVILSDGTEEIALKEDPGTGCYYTPTDYAGEVGKTYTLTVDGEDDGKPFHLTASDTMPAGGMRIDDFDYYKLTDSLWVFAIWAQDFPGIESHYSADLRVNGVAHGYGDWMTVDGYDMFDGSYLVGAEYLFYSATGLVEGMGSMGGMGGKGDTPPLKEGDVIELYFYSLSTDFNRILMSMMNESFAHMPLFTPQPGNVPTNIHGENAAGIFGLAHCAKASLVIGNPDRNRLEMMADHGMLPPNF